MTNWRTFCTILLLSILHATQIIYSEYIPPGPRYRCPEKSYSIFPCTCIKESDDGLSIRCENANLASLAVGLNNLASEDIMIEELTLYKCFIGSLYGTIFFKLNCKKIHIEDTPIQLIDENVFMGINETLQELHIRNSEMTEFPKLAIKILGNLKQLTIDTHKIANLSKDIFADSRSVDKLEILRITNGHLNNIPIESFQMLRKLKTLDLHGNHLIELNRNQFKNLRDVDVLDISFNRLKKLESSHIADLTKLSWCNVSNNNLLELTRGTFARNSVLRVLNMSGNKIKRLDTNSFRGMRFLRRLYLRDNNIADIGRSTFGSVTRIGTIDLARNAIKKIDFQMFYQLNYVEIIDVSENNITEIQKQSFKDLYLTTINISHNMVSTIESGSFENCVNITLLDLSHNMIQDIDRDAFDSTSYVSNMQLSYNYLTDLSQVPLHNMTGLTILNVSHNEIEVIPKNTFPKLYELHTIDVSHNKLHSIGNAVFQTLFSLRSLNFSHNSLDQIKNAVFGTLPTLLELDLSNNMIREISRAALTKLISLRDLNIENNRMEKLFEIPISLNHLVLCNNWINEIPEKTWPSMNALLSLDLTGNRLENGLSGSSFKGLLTLQTLNLSSNGLARVPWESLSPLSTLQYVNLQRNNLTYLPKAAFGKLPVVFEVNLHGNQISNISTHAFDGLLQLLTLNLSSNTLRNIVPGIFYGLVSLRKLDLSNNLLDKIDNKTHGALDDCLSLEKIDLSHNKISFVTRNTFPSNRYIPYRLKEIDLSYNIMPIVTYDLTFGTKKVTHLNLSNNFINDIRKHVIGNLSALESLDLSNNQLDEFVANRDNFNLPQSLKVLNLDNSRLISLSTDAVVNVTNMTELSLRNNQLTIIDLKLIDKIKNGLTIHLEGNPLLCDCRIRPLRHVFKSNQQIDYSNVICDEPPILFGNSLLNITDDRLNCLNETIDNLVDYDVLPDIRFRDITYFKGQLTVRWYITSFTKDIADFYVNIRHSKNTVLHEYHLPYDVRSITVRGDTISSDYDSNLQVCVMGKNSFGQITNWFDSQCTNLPNNFESIKLSYGERSSSLYKIYPIGSGNGRRSVNNMFGSSAITLVIKSNLMTMFLLFNIICFFNIV